MSDLRQRSISPPARGRSPEQEKLLEEKRAKAKEAMRKKNTQQADFFDKYAYHIVIGAFVALCVIAFGSTLFRSSQKLSTIPAISLDEIQSHNSQGYSYNLGPNEFFKEWMLADAKYILNNHLTFKSSIGKCPSADDQRLIPERYNFREKNQLCAHQVYNQRNCSSSYSIAAVSAISDRLCLQRDGGFIQQLSPQSPLSCDKKKNFGCAGGSVSRVFEYVKKNGLVTNECMQYEGNDQEVDCPSVLQTCEKFFIEDYCVISSEETIKREIVINGPVVTVMSIYRDFLVYKDGVYQVIEGTSRFQQGQAVKIIGWDKINNQDYWIIENSWTDSWGQNGLAYVGIGQSQLQIEDYVLAPLIQKDTQNASQGDQVETPED